MLSLSQSHYSALNIICLPPTGSLSSAMGPTPKKSGRGGRRSRVTKPINIPPPPAPIPPTSITTCIQAGLTPISPAPIMTDGKQRPVVTTTPTNTINLGKLLSSVYI